MYNHWPWMRHEPELRSLYEWLDEEAPRTGAERKWGIWGGITGGAFGLAGGSIGLIGGAFHVNIHQHGWVYVVPFLAAALTSGLSAVFIAGRQLKIDTETRRTFAQAKSFTWQLFYARWYGGLKAHLGADRALALNDAAEQVLRCHRALRSPAWKAVPQETDYASIRVRVGNAMDLAMARLVSIVSRGASGTDPEVTSLISDMRTAADEATRTASHLAGQSGVSAGVGTDLRQALSDMRILNEAQEEFERIVGRGD